MGAKARNLPQNITSAESTLGRTHGVAVDSMGDFHSVGVPCLLDLDNSLGDKEDSFLERLSDFEGGEKS